MKKKTTLDLFGIIYNARNNMKTNELLAVKLMLIAYQIFITQINEHSRIIARLNPRTLTPCHV